MYVKEEKDVLTLEDFIETKVDSAPIYVENYVVLGKDLNAHTKDGQLLSTLTVYHKKKRNFGCSFKGKCQHE